MKRLFLFFHRASNYTATRPKRRPKLNAEYAEIRSLMIETARWILITGALCLCLYDLKKRDYDLEKTILNMREFDCVAQKMRNPDFVCISAAEWVEYENYLRKSSARDQNMDNYFEDARIYL